MDESTLQTPRNKGKERELEPDFEEGDSEATVRRELLEDDELEYVDEELEYVDRISGRSRGSSSRSQTRSERPNSESSNKADQHGGSSSTGTTHRDGHSPPSSPRAIPLPSSRNSSRSSARNIPLLSSHHSSRSSARNVPLPSSRESQ